MIALILNVIWVVLGGFVMFLAWLLAAALMVLTIIGIPWARAAFNIALYSLWPFGREAVDRSLLTGRDDLGTGAFGALGNVLWFVLAGWWLALGHVLAAIAVGLTIIGLPLAWAHLKLAGASLFPVGKAIVDSDVAAELRRRRAAGIVDRLPH
ncbi:YccF domain-containing protein [Novispirillum sp. DQ9]|uniref:YccF domain-containing protein n=1 Tax=Novispirillum sp. DQ9 TaxID=3398612 RepID=UPI003C7C3A53